MAIDDFDPISVETAECPYPFYEALRSEAPVYRVPGRGFFLVGRYETALRVLADTDAFSSSSSVGVPSGTDGMHPEPVLPSGRPVHTLLTADPPQHQKYRSLVNRAFSARRVAAMEPAVRTIAQELCAGFAGRGEVELIYDFAVPLPLIVICDLVGVPRSHLRTFKRWSDGIAQLGGLTTPEHQAAIARERGEFRNYLIERIEERRAEPRDDLMSALLAVQFEGERPLTQDELLSILQQFLVAGNETTTNVIASGMLLLLLHPDQLAAVQADRGLIPNLVEEVLRYESPVQAHFRRAARDTVLDGVPIAAGTGVGVLFGCANRDEAQFRSAEEFDVRRPNARTHLAFSQGIHYCVGAPLARLEAIVAFELLLDTLRNVRLAPGKNDFTHTPSFTHRGLKHLYLAFDPA